MQQALAERQPTIEWWLAANHHRTHKDTPMDLIGSPWQIDILQDGAREMVVRKSTQCGVSECMLLWELGCLDRGLNVFAVWPDQDLRGLYVRERFDVTVANTPYYAAMVERARIRLRSSGGKGRAAADAQGMKQLGTAAINLVGSNSQSAMKQFAADAFIIEEVDQCNQKNLALVPDRTMASKHRLGRWVGNPSVEGYGIDEKYTESDCKAWLIRCGACREWQELDWFVNVVREVDDNEYQPITPGGINVVCCKCGGVVDPHGQGHWVAKHPQRELSGYHVSALFANQIPTAEIYRTFVKALRKQTLIERFHNSVLGVAYSSPGAKASPGMLDKLVSTYPQQNVGNGCYIGIDVGTLLHAIVLDRDNRVIAIKAVHEMKHLDELMNAYGATAVIDARPESRLARDFAKRHKGRVWLCTRYDVRNDGVAFKMLRPQKPKAGGKRRLTVGMDVLRLEADRTISLDTSHADLLDGVIKLPRDARSVPDFYPQMCAPTRVFSEERQVYVWVEGNQPDHYRHALNYAVLARDIGRRSGMQFTRTLSKGAGVVT